MALKLRERGLIAAEYTVVGAALCLLSGMSLAQVFGVVGIGTIITAFFMGPLIAFFNKHVAEPMLAFSFGK